MITIEKIKCRRWSDQVEELWVIYYEEKPLCQAFTRERAEQIASDTFPGCTITVIL